MPFLAPCSGQPGPLCSLNNLLIFQAQLGLSAPCKHLQGTGEGLGCHSSLEGIFIPFIPTQAPQRFPNSWVCSAPFSVLTGETETLSVPPKRSSSPSALLGVSSGTGLVEVFGKRNQWLNGWEGSGERGADRPRM